VLGEGVAAVSDRLYSLNVTFRQTLFSSDRLYYLVSNPYQPDSRSGVAVILCTLRSVPLNSSSALKRMPTSIFSTP